MRCHECGAPAAYAARSDSIRVGLCEEHLRSRLEEFPAEEIKHALLVD